MLESNIVEVDFEVLVKQKQQEATAHTITEKHNMRYLFAPEVATLANENGMQVIAAYKWLEHEELGDQNCWNAVFVLRKQLATSPHSPVVPARLMSLFLQLTTALHIDEFPSPFLLA